MRYLSSIIFSTLFAASILLLIPARPAHAQAVNGTAGNFIEAGNKAVGGCSYMSEDIQTIVDPEQPASLEKTTVGECDPNDPSQAGAIRTMSRSIAFITTTKPVSSQEYIADLWNNVGLPGTQTAYAQTTGIGFNALTPVLPIWKAFRNLAYFIYVIIFVVVGFMIMFRAKINPQTMVTVQSALPKLVITLVLITFSYAIAGLLIDLIYVGIYIPAFLLQGDVFTDATTVTSRLLNNSVFGIVFDPEGADVFIRNPAEAAGRMVDNLLGDNFLSSIAGWITESLSRLIFGAIALVAMFKLFITLGVGFVTIILYVVTAPVHIMMNALPGSQAFSNWFRGLLANVAMFPAVAILFMIGAALMGPSAANAIPRGQSGSNPWGVVDGVGYGGSNVGSQSNWIPPFIALRGLGSGVEEGVDIVVALIGFMTILIAPQIATATRDFFKVEAPKYTSGIGSTAAAGAGLATLLPKKWWQQKEQQVAAERQAAALGSVLTKK